MYEPAKQAVGRESTVSTILLVEDDRTVRELLRFLLKLEGHEVLAADRGDTALQLGSRHEGRIHLLLTDIMMPGMTGDKLAERLVAIRPEVRVLFMSGHVGRDILRGSPVRHAGFIRKPFSPAVLARSVKQILTALPTS
jgi:CheY-like chemotaxis protein